MPHDETDAPNLILSESVSALLLYLQGVVADRLRDDVETEALAARWAEGQVPGIYGC